MALRDLVPAIPARLRAIHWLLNCVGKESNWFWKWKFRTADHHVRFEPLDKYGWPWFPDTISWVVPTTFAILAFNQIPCSCDGFEGIPLRVDCGIQMLFHRACPAEDGTRATVLSTNAPWRPTSTTRQSHSWRCEIENNTQWFEMPCGTWKVLPRPSRLRGVWLGRASHLPHIADRLACLPVPCLDFRISPAQRTRARWRSRVGSGTEPRTVGLWRSSMASLVESYL